MISKGWMMSGYSGAGTNAGQVDAEGRSNIIPKVTLQSLGGGVKAYSVTDHIHEREAASHLSHRSPDSKRAGDANRNLTSASLLLPSRVLVEWYYLSLPGTPQEQDASQRKRN